MRAHLRTALVALIAVPTLACEVLFGIDHFTPGEADAAVEGGVSDGGVGPVTMSDGCPSGRGPKMVRVGSSCIDSTEVTEEQYGLFLTVDAGPQPVECSWNTTFVPGKGPKEEPLYCTSGAGAPVRCVDFCDARAFCDWAGKRLCGAPSGGKGDYDGIADPTKSEWLAACGGAERRAFPYGDTYRAKACNDLAENNGSPTNAGKLTTCEGGEMGLFDMSGNVHEWENACIPAEGGVGGAANDRCRIRGGSMTDSDPLLLRCDASNGAARSFMASNVGFRCCATAQ